MLFNKFSSDVDVAADALSWDHTLRSNSQKESLPLETKGGINVLLDSKE